VAAVGESRIVYDARGLAEPHADAPRTATIEDGRATFDARDLTTRQINLELRRLLYEEGILDVTIQNPGAKHSIGVGILTRCRLRFEGSLGYFGLGLIDGPEITVTGRVGWSACENMMSGVVVVESNAGSLTGAAMRGGDLVVKGRVGARTGIDQKGGTIIVGGDAGSMTGFMMQRGRMIIVGDAGPGLGDSMYDGTIYVGGTVKSLGIDCVPGEWTDADTELVERKFSIYGLGSPPELQKFVCGKKLYNYDNLEPAERKLVL
jgi:glutamate synthase domain-containing protein 3